MDSPGYRRVSKAIRLYGREAGCSSTWLPCERSTLRHWIESREKMVRSRGDYLVAATSRPVARNEASKANSVNKKACVLRRLFLSQTLRQF